jgi:hypothetical protein
MKRKAIVIAMLCGMLAGCLSGCTPAQQAKFTKIEHQVKTGFKIADSSLTALDAVVNVAAPGSTTAKHLNDATVTAHKVDGVVQAITIDIPVDAPAAPTSVPNGGTTAASVPGQ